LGGVDEAEQQRGYKSSPNTSKFNDINELSIAMNIQYEREVARLSEIMIWNPQAWKEVENRMLEVAQGQGGQLITTNGLAPVARSSPQIEHPQLEIIQP
jgi:hypothetical protein